VTDELKQNYLFDPGAPTHLTLMDRFLVPPFSVFDSRAGYWQDRKRAWLDLGIKSELGRDEQLLGFSSIVNDRGKPCPYCTGTGQLDEGLGPRRCRYCGGAGTGYSKRTLKTTSVFDPVLCEIAYRWLCAEGGLVLDPFAGGSVRGIVAAQLHRQYVGIDLRTEQCQANEQQAAEIGASRGWPHTPHWIVGDSRELLPGPPPDVIVCRYAKGNADLLFSCPPYYDLEQYSDDPRDLSNASSYTAFQAAYFDIIDRACQCLKPDRFACFVVGEVRNKQHGHYVGLVTDTIIGFQEAGLRYYNEAILLTPLGSAPIRAAQSFGGSRKLGKTHQNILMFVKGDAKAAAEWCGTVAEVALESGGATWHADGSLSYGDEEFSGLTDEPEVTA